jgi:hypothetical protein
MITSLHPKRSQRKITIIIYAVITQNVFLIHSTAVEFKK